MKKFAFVMLALIGVTCFCSCKKTTSEKVNDSIDTCNVDTMCIDSVDSVVMDSDSVKI